MLNCSNNRSHCLAFCVCEQKDYLRNQIACFGDMFKFLGVCLKEFHEALQRIPHLRPVICYSIKSSNGNDLVVLRSEFISARHCRRPHNACGDDPYEGELEEP